MSNIASSPGNSSVRTTGKALAAATAFLLLATAAQADDYWSHSPEVGNRGGGNTTHTTGTQGQVGNAFCDPPTGYIGKTPFHPDDWSCPGDTEAKRQKLLGGVQDNQHQNNQQETRKKLFGRTQRNDTPRPLRWQTDDGTPKRNVFGRSDPGYQPVTGLTQEQAQHYARRRDRILNTPGVMMGNAYAKAMGLRQFEAGVAQSMRARKFPFQSYNALRSSMEGHARR
jgi:hypothetical protein